MLRSSILLISSIGLLNADVFQVTGAGSGDSYCGATTHLAACPEPTCGSFTSSSPSLDLQNSCNSGTNQFLAEAYLSFDTSSIPDNATVSSASVSFRISLKSAVNSFCSILGDYSATATAKATSAFTGNAFTVAYSTWSGWDTTTTHTVSLTNLTNISKTGITGILLGVQCSSPPTGLNDILIDAYETGNPVKPSLIVIYSISSRKVIFIATLIPRRTCDKWALRRGKCTF